MNDSVKSILPSFILVGGEGEDFDPFHDFFPENLKKLPQYWNFGELLNASRYQVGDGDGNFEVRMGPLSESERVRIFLDSLDTDGISDFLKLILGRELNTYEDLQIVLALQRMKGMSLVGEILAAISGYKFNAFYRRYPTGRKTKVKRYRYGMWVYGYNVYFEEVEVDEYYLGEGWEKYSGYLGRPVRYDGEELYTGTGDLVYGEIRFIPGPCEVWITTDVSHLEVDSDLKVFEEIIHGFRNLTNSCAKIFFFPFMNFDQDDFRLRDEVALEEVRYLVGVAGGGGVEVKTPEEVTEQDVIVDPRVQEYQRVKETYS
jgi:hypothetical protein